MSIATLDGPTRALPEPVAYAARTELFVEPEPVVDLANEATMDLALVLSTDRRKSFGARVLNVMGHTYEAVVCTTFGVGVGLIFELLRRNDNMHGEITIGALAATFLLRFFFQSARQRARR